MQKLTAIERLCGNLMESDPDLFESNTIKTADKKLYDTLIKPAIAANHKKGFEIEELIIEAISANQLQCFVAGYITATKLEIDAEKRATNRKAVKA